MPLPIWEEQKVEEKTEAWVSDMNEHVQDSTDTISQDMHYLFLEVAFFNQDVEERRKIMKPLLFEDCDSSSLHLLLLRSVFLASDRLGEKSR